MYNNYGVLNYGVRDSVVKMDIFLERRKTCLELVLLISLLGLLDILLTQAFLSLGGTEGNKWLFFSHMLERDYVAGMLFIVSCKALLILVVLKGVIMLPDIPRWLNITLVFTSTYYFILNIFSVDYLFFLTSGDSVVHLLISSL